MRAEYSDERDAAWERDDARYRLYLFEGADNAVTTIDILDASIEEALESAEVESRHDELLWSLAMVETDSRGLRGLIWLSGMDYNDPPGSPREWDRRRQMQQRYLAAKARRGIPPTLPNGLRVIRVFPEYQSGWPLWESFTEDYLLTGHGLGLSPELSAELFDWNEAWLRGGRLDDPLPDRWVERGWALVERLRIELAGIAEVRPEFLSDSAP